MTKKSTPNPYTRNQEISTTSIDSRIFSLVRGQVTVPFHFPSRFVFAVLLLLIATWSALVGASKTLELGCQTSAAVHRPAFLLRNFWQFWQAKDLNLFPPFLCDREENKNMRMIHWDLTYSAKPRCMQETKIKMREINLEDTDPSQLGRIFREVSFSPN